MTTTEKIAATYLRLNGFFLLPQFTVFDGAQHNHIDLLGLRTAGSREVANGHALPVDGNLFDRLMDMGAKPDESPTGIIAEVKTGKVNKDITPEHIEYAKRFINLPTAYNVWFYGIPPEPPTIDGDHLRISLPYAIDWIIHRFDQMMAIKDILAKQKSWTWSEEFLADLLVLRSIGVLNRLP